MKPKFGREIALLCLPVALIGAAIWLRAGRAPLPTFLKTNPFVAGPLRVEFTPFQTVAVTPFDVSQNLTWATTTIVTTPGKPDVPPGWKIAATSGSFPTKTRVVYRTGKSWREAPSFGSQKTRVASGINLDTNELTMRVDLAGVPRDAEEVSLRGEFDCHLYYSGAIPRGWKPPKNLKIGRFNHDLAVPPRVFDVQIKGPDDAFPNPQVSRVPDLETIGAAWYFTPNVYSLAVRLRDKSGRGIFQKVGNLQVKNFSLRDGDGKKLRLFDNDGKGREEGVSSWSIIYRQNYYRDLPLNEAIATFVPFSGAPRGDWGAVKPPLTLDAQVSDGTSWPLRVRATLRQQSGDFSTLAQLPASE